MNCFGLHQLLRDSGANGYVIRRVYRSLRVIACGRPEPLPPGPHFSIWWESLSALQQQAALLRACSVPETALALPLLLPDGTEPTP